MDITLAMNDDLELFNISEQMKAEYEVPVMIGVCFMQKAITRCGKLLSRTEKRIGENREENGRG